MFQDNRNRNNEFGEPHYYQNVTAYRSYEDVVAAKRRRTRFRRGMTVVVLLVAVGSAGAYMLLRGEEPSGAVQPDEAGGSQQDGAGLLNGDTVSPILNDGEQDRTGEEKEDGGFALSITPKPKSGQGAVVVKDVSDIVKKVRPSVVGVVTESFQTYSTSSTGSGIILSSDGYIVTNNHVVEGGDNISVTLDEGGSYAAKLIGADAKTDIAVIKIDAANLPAAEFGDSDKVEAGEAAVAIGNPMGLELQGTVTAGIISAINRNIVVGNSRMNLLQTDASINPGNSGGALINEYGQVIGVNSAKISIENYEGLGFAIPINTVKPIVEELIDKGYVSGRPLTGISGRNISAMAAAFYGLPQGILVDAVAPGSDAATKGLAAGDILIGVDDIRVETISDACTLRDEHKAGDPMKLTFYRRGGNYEITIKLLEETNQVTDYNF